LGDAGVIDKVMEEAVLILVTETVGEVNDCLLRKGILFQTCLISLSSDRKCSFLFGLN
jgi:hypothetical protein